MEIGQVGKQRVLGVGIESPATKQNCNPGSTRELLKSLGRQ